MEIQESENTTPFGKKGEDTFGKLCQQKVIYGSKRRAQTATTRQRKLANFQEKGFQRGGRIAEA